MTLEQAIYWCRDIAREVVEERGRVGKDAVAVTIPDDYAATLNEAIDTITKHEI